MSFQVAWDIFHVAFLFILCLLFCLISGEIVVNEVNFVKKCISTENNQDDLVGKLICTNFKVSFIPQDAPPKQVSLQSHLKAASVSTVSLLLVENAVVIIFLISFQPLSGKSRLCGWHGTAESFQRMCFHTRVCMCSASGKKEGKLVLFFFVRRIVSDVAQGEKITRCCFQLRRRCFP